jgi:hypothetical protein
LFLEFFSRKGAKESRKGKTEVFFAPLRLCGRNYFIAFN